MPEALQLHVRRVHRDDKVIGEITDAVVAFLAELDQLETQLRELM